MTSQTDGDNRIRTFLLRSAIVAGATAYVLLLLETYHYLIYLRWYYIFPWREIGGYLVLNSAITIAPSLWLPLKITRASHVYLWILYFGGYVPAVFVPIIASKRPADEVLWLSFAILFSFAALCAVGRIPLMRIPFRPVSQSQWRVLWILVAALTLYVGFTHGWDIQIRSLEDNWLVRSTYRGKSQAVSLLAGYAAGWLLKVVNPLMIIFGLTRRNVLMVLLGTGGQLMLFGLMGPKEALFSPLVIFGLYVAIGKELKARRFALMITAGAVAITAICLLSAELTVLFTRRLLIMGVVTAWYFDFFTFHPKAHLASSLVGRLMGIKSLDLADLIGDMNYRGAHANANFWADAFANFGYPGIVVWTLTLAAILWVFDSLTRDRSLTIASLLLSYPALSLANSALQTCLLSHGLLLALFLTAIVPPERRLGMNRRKSPTHDLIRHSGTVPVPAEQRLT